MGDEIRKQELVWINCNCIVHVGKVLFVYRGFTVSFRVGKFRHADRTDHVSFLVQTICSLADKLSSDKGVCAEKALQLCEKNAGVIVPAQADHVTVAGA